MLPGPATTDVVGRLSALSPGDRVTSSLPCRALCRQRSAGADVSANIRAGQMVVRSIYTPHGERNLSSARPDFLRLSVAVTPLPRYRPAPVQLALRQSPLAGVSPRSPAPVQLGAGTATPVAPAPDAPRLPAVSTPLTAARFTAVRTCRASPWSGLVAVRRAVPQVAERRLGLAPGLAVAQVLQRFARLAPRVAVPQILNRLPGLAPRLALAQVADGRLGLATDLALPQVADRCFGLAPGLALAEVLQGRLGLAAPLGGLSAVQPGGHLGPPRP